jgi:hypothetical protein
MSIDKLLWSALVFLILGLGLQLVWDASLENLSTHLARSVVVTAIWVAAMYLMGTFEKTQ